MSLPKHNSDRLVYKPKKSYMKGIFIKMKNSKKILALILAGLMSVTLLASCGNNNTDDKKDTDTAATEPAGDDTTTAPPETEPTGFDASTITSNTYGVVGTSLIAHLSFTGSDATLNLISNGEDKSVSGACTIDENIIKIGDKEFTYKFVATFLTLQDGDTKYQLTKAADEAKDAEYKGAYALLTNSWSGDGASLSFDGATAKLKIDGTKVDYNGTYAFDSASSLTVTDTSSGNPANLALDCETFESGRETESFPGNLATDGDYTTRFASATVDPSFLTVDLGSVKTVGAVSIYWEAASGKEYTIDVSTDNENWTTVAEEKENSINGTADDPVAVSYEFTPVEAQYVRMHGTVRNTGYGYSMYEFEIFEKLLGEATVTLAYDTDKVSITYDGVTYNLSK